jgi:hypothetical protein
MRAEGLMRRYIYMTHYSDQFEILVEGPRILRISRMFSDSGIIRQIKFDDLPNGIRDRVLREMDKLDYSI